MINELYNWPFWIGLSVSMFAVLVSLTIFLIQVRPVLETQLRVAVKPYVEKSNRRGYILYCDVKNVGLTPIRYRIRSHSERYGKTPSILLMGSSGRYNDSVQPAASLNAIHTLKPGDSSYHPMAMFEFDACLPEQFDATMNSIFGETSIYVDAVNRKGRVSRIGKLLSRKMDIHFNALYVDTAESR